MKEMICIVCPRGCRLTVEEDESGEIKVKGNACPKGAAYGRDEMLNPRRVVTSTVRVDSKELPRCPVKTDCPIPKDMIFSAMALLDDVDLTPPVKRGDIVVADILGTGSNFVATRDINSKKEV